MESFLYENLSSINTVHKNIVQIMTAPITGWEDSSIIDPVLLLDYDSTIFTCNYMYIPEYQRYYNVKNVEIVDGRRIRVIAHVDVLMTYAGAIDGMPAVVARNENKYNLYLNDKAFKTYNYTNISTTAFPNGFTANANYILTVANGGASA